MPQEPLDLEALSSLDASATPAPWHLDVIEPGNIVIWAPSQGLVFPPLSEATKP